MSYLCHVSLCHLIFLLVNVLVNASCALLFVWQPTWSSFLNFTLSSVVRLPYPIWKKDEDTGKYSESTALVSTRKSYVEWQGRGVQHWKWFTKISNSLFSVASLLSCQDLWLCYHLILFCPKHPENCETLDH